MACLSSQIHHVDVRSQPNVIGEIPAWIVGIVVEHDVIIVPIPVIAIGKVVGSDTEIISAEPEAVGSATFDAPHVAAADPHWETAVFPGMVEVVMCVAARVANPLVIMMDMGRFRMSFLVAIRRPGLLAWSLVLRHVLVLLGLLSRRIFVLLRRILSLNTQIALRSVAGDVAAADGSVRWCRGMSASLRMSSRGGVIFVLRCKGKRKDK